MPSPRTTAYTIAGIVFLPILGYAGYRCGRHIECIESDASIAKGFIGWSLLGTAGPGYAAGRMIGPKKGCSR